MEGLPTDESPELLLADGSLHESFSKEQGRDAVLTLVAPSSRMSGRALRRPVRPVCRKASKPGAVPPPVAPAGSPTGCCSTSISMLLTQVLVPYSLAVRNTHRRQRRTSDQGMLLCVATAGQTLRWSTLLPVNVDASYRLQCPVSAGPLPCLEYAVSTPCNPCSQRCSGVGALDHYAVKNPGVDGIR